MNSGVELELDLNLEGTVVYATVHHNNPTHTTELIASMKPYAGIASAHDVEAVILPWYKKALSRLRAARSWPICRMQGCGQLLVPRIKDGYEITLHLTCPETALFARDKNFIETVLTKLGYM